MNKTLTAVATALAVLAAPAAAAAAPGEAMRDRLADVVAAGAIGVLAEVRDERGVWRGSAGAAELGGTRAVPVRGRFRVGSITKTFLATVVLQLVAERRLRLDDTVGAWLPGAVPDGDRITVRHLLNHTSGLYDVVPTLPMPPSPEFFADRWRTWTPDELVRRALAHPPVHETPGEVFAYSNNGYLLLGQIVGKATGRTYGEEIERRIIRPLRLRGTSMPGTSPWIPGPHPHGYVPGEQGLVDHTAMNPSVFGAAGELISTTGDLNRFFAALLGGRLLPAHLLEAMKTPGVEGGRYGLGLTSRVTACGVRVYGNDGDALAYQTWSFSTPGGRRQVTIAITTGPVRDLDAEVGAVLDEALCEMDTSSSRH